MENAIYHLGSLNKVFNTKEEALEYGIEEKQKLNPHRIISEMDVVIFELKRDSKNIIID